MSTVVSPTYLLAPNWTFQPDGPIALGNIIADPFKPHRVLSKPTAETPIPSTQHSVELNWSLETEKIRNSNLGVWTKVLDIVTVSGSARRGKAATIAFEMSQLDTIYFSEDPSAANISLRAEDARVKAALKLGRRFLRGTAYMISGLKIARDFRVTQSAITDTGTTLEAGGAIIAEASVGVNLDVTSASRKSHSAEATHDVVFAYQLLRIKPKSSGEDLTFGVDEFQNEAALLHDDAGSGYKDVEETPELELKSAPIDELVKTQEGFTVKPDEDQHAWLFRDEVISRCI
ncbi:hypothetical protein K4K53_004644 [Colletotrichum sp. SAR 10_77]|nr:hypothetical protein K4K53_004644 [Colletotrichum sp. SAR 10_77]